MINGIDFRELESEKYWSFPKTYKNNAKEETKNMIFSGDYLGSRKMDGAYYRFIKEEDGQMYLQGRSRGVSGKFLDKIELVPQLSDFFNFCPNGTVLLGEVYFPDNEGSKNVTSIMGCKKEKAIARQEVGSKLHYYVFDVWAWGGESLLETPVEERVEVLKKIALYIEGLKIEYVEVAQVYEGEELWNQLQSIFDDNGEGIVITKKGTHPEPGKRPARKTVKIKKEISETIDCVLTGHYKRPTREYTGKDIKNWKYWENIKNGDKIEDKLYDDYAKGATIEPVTKPYFYDWAGSLEIGLVKGDKIVPIGFISGVTDDIKRGIVSESELYKGRPCEVSAMELDNESGALRHPVFIKFRDDLTLKDCTWEKVYG